MTMFIGAASLESILGANDYRGVDGSVWRMMAQHGVELIYPHVFYRYPYDYSSDFWPGGRLGVGGDGGVSQNSFLDATYGWTLLSIDGGANSRLGFVGYTRDANGSVLAGCTVRCIRNSTDEMVSKVTSDANGFYIATSPYNDAHFLVIHNAAGDRAGASVNTILPA